MKIIYKPLKRAWFLYINFSCNDFNKLSIKYQSHSKSTKVDGIERNIFVCHNHSDEYLTIYHNPYLSIKMYSSI